MLSFLKKLLKKPGQCKVCLTTSYMSSINNKASPVFNITFAGDTSLGDYYLSQPGKEDQLERLSTNSMSFFEGVKPLVKNSDYFILNLETVLAGNPNSSLKGKKYLNWDDPCRTIEILKKIGVKAVSLANNHTMDFGHAVMLETRRKLLAAGIECIGGGANLSEAKRPLILELQGKKSKINLYVLTGLRASKRYREIYNFFAGKEKPGINSLSTNRITKQIKEIRKKDPDAIIVLFPHWQGFDYQQVVPVMAEKCRLFLKAGADYVFAHGTHCVNPVEVSSYGTIAYSIGNFVFNSPGRYAKLNAPPYSLIVKMKITESQHKWDITVDFTPIATDNLKTGYFVRPLNDAEKKEIDYFLCGELSTASPADNIVDVVSALRELICGSRSQLYFDFNSLEFVEKEINQISFVQQEFDERFRRYYDKLLESKILKYNHEFYDKAIEVISSAIKKDHISYSMLRKFNRKPCSISAAISFRDIIIENREKRFIGCPDYASILDQKDIAYKFADLIGVRRPATASATYKFKEIAPQEGPVVIKPVDSTGAMGVYLIFNKYKILSVRENLFLDRWQDLEKDVHCKIEGDRSRDRKYFRNDEWLIEEMVINRRKALLPPTDLKFYCFYGEIALVLEIEHNPSKQFCWWDENMSLVSTGKYETKKFRGLGFTDEDLKVVKNFSLQLPWPFVRLDMLKGFDGLFFGEATYYPGNYHLFNIRWNRVLGEAYHKAQARMMTDLINGKQFKAYKQLLKDEL